MRGLNQVTANAYKEVSRTKIRLAAYAQMQAAPRMQTHAQTHAPWHDITGMARRGLRGGSFFRGNKAIIYIAHGVDYGVHLELAHDRKYQILDPTIDHFKSIVWADYQRIMRS
jgi:hypothetical protein